MNAISIIERIRGAGGVINLADEAIKLRIPASLRDQAIADVKVHKDAIKRALRLAADERWDAADWRAFFDERAAIAEYDGGQTRQKADAMAYEACVVEHMNRHPGRSDRYACAGCHKSGSDAATIVPFGLDAESCSWLHPECWPEWNRRRRSEAGRALSDIGIRMPPLTPAGASAPSS